MGRTAGTFGLEVFAAGCGCAVADGTFHPLETFKVRQQAWSKPLVTVAREMHADAGGGARGALVGWWRPGLAPTICRAFTYTGFRIGAYPAVRDAYAAREGVPDLVVRLCAGATTGFVGAFVFNPLDLLRVRLQLAPTRYPTYDVFAGLRTIARDGGGPAELWRGWPVSVARAALLSGSQLATYDSSKRFFKARLGADEGAPLHVACSLLSGFVAQLVIQPVDTVKTLVMNTDTAESSPARFARLARESGPLALYRGLLPALMRQGPVMLVQLPLTEQIRRLFGLGYF